MSTENRRFYFLQICFYSDLAPNAFRIYPHFEIVKNSIMESILATTGSSMASSVRAFSEKMWRVILEDAFGGCDPDSLLAVSFCPDALEGIEDPFWEEDVMPSSLPSSPYLFLSPSDSSSPTTSQATEGSSLACPEPCPSRITIWSTNFFLWSRRHKRIVLVWLKGTVRSGSCKDAEDAADAPYTHLIHFNDKQMYYAEEDTDDTDDHISGSSRCDSPFPMP